LWNTKVAEAKAVSVAEHLAEGCSLKATARLAKVHPSVVTRLNRKVGIHAEAFHDERVQGLEVVALEADERHGYAHDKSQPQWEAEVIDPVSKLVVSQVQGQRDETLIRRLLEDSAKRLPIGSSWSCSRTVKPAMLAYFLRFSARPTIQADKGVADAFPTCAIASRARWRMCKS
jgi:hypothetical protein